MIGIPDTHGRGAIVNVGSALGWRAQIEQAHYAAAKAGVLALTRVEALEVAAAGVRVNAVVPGLVPHPNLAKVSRQDLIACQIPVDKKRS